MPGCAARPGTAGCRPSEANVAGLCGREVKVGSSMTRSATKAEWEDAFRSWGKAPSKTEGEKCEHAETAVKKAIAASDAFPEWVKDSLSVFAQGSYANGTNIGQESDVDVNVCCTGIWFSDFTHASDVTPANIDSVPSPYRYATFKDDVETALKDYFGKKHVTRGNKAFDIHENTYRVDADVVATFEHRRWTHRAEGTVYYTRGVQFLTDDGHAIVNWPSQNNDNGIAKNNDSGRRFKALARILKELRCEMLAAAVPAADGIGSFLLECLAYNVSDAALAEDDYYDMVRRALVELYHATKTDQAGAKYWFEVNGLKLLFQSGQPWTREQTNAFLLVAWRFVGFE